MSPRNSAGVQSFINSEEGDHGGGAVIRVQRLPKHREGNLPLSGGKEFGRENPVKQVVWLYVGATWLCITCEGWKASVPSEADKP